MDSDRAGREANTADVVVVGAGLAGLQCARLVAEAGLDVVLLDRKEDVGERVHTTGIFVRKSLEDFPLPPSCLGPPVRRAVLYSPARRALSLSSRHDEFRVGRMAALYRERLDRCLEAASPFHTSQSESHRTLLVFDDDNGLADLNVVWMSSCQASSSSTPVHPHRLTPLIVQAHLWIGKRSECAN